MIAFLRYPDGTLSSIAGAKSRVEESVDLAVESGAEVVRLSFEDEQRFPYTDSRMAGLRRIDGASRTAAKGQQLAGVSEARAN